ncbi:hypothetical protein F5Y19DRAFT_281027 [Xylariaceae sp. FL1651]|nr:hypothetical protein F5Y19DRAFT_281027 [Xylariaceae sp. FL1651]
MGTGTGIVQLQEEPEWLGVPMAGQFPLSNWLSDRLGAHRQPADLWAQPDLVSAPQFHLPEMQEMSSSHNIVGGSQDQQGSLGGTHSTAVTNTVLVSQMFPKHEKRHKCTECPLRFPESRDLRRHIETVHRKRVVQCPRCTKTFKHRRDNLKRHIDKYCKAKD